MDARQPLSTFTADSATAVGVRASSHAGEETRNKVNTLFRKGKDVKMKCVFSEGPYVQCCWPWCPWRSGRWTSWIPPQQESVPEARSWRADRWERAPEDKPTDKSYDGKDESKNTKPQIQGGTAWASLWTCSINVCSASNVFFLDDFCNGFNCCCRF